VTVTVNAELDPAVAPLTSFTSTHCVAVAPAAIVPRDFGVLVTVAPVSAPEHAPGATRTSNVLVAVVPVATRERGIVPVLATLKVCRAVSPTSMLLHWLATKLDETVSEALPETTVCDETVA
jgi:hypothetical protein